MSSENKNRRSVSLRSQGHSHSLRSKESEEGVASGAVGPVGTVRSDDFLERHRLGSSMDAEDARSFYAVWLEKVFGIGRAIEAERERHSTLIHPASPFHLASLSMTGLLLLYTAVVTPITVAFFWDSDSCDSLPTLNFDVAVDSYFLFDIFLTFFVGVYKNGHYYDSLKWVAMNYVKSMFIFDLITSFPVSFVEVAILAGCANGLDNSIISPSELRLARVVKPLRLAKLVRVIKVAKTVSIFSYVGALVRMPPRWIRLSKVLILIFVAVHVCACLFWLVKQVSTTKDEMDYFLVSQTMSGDIETTSWEIPSKYLLCVYFITSVLTTVGFGDVSGMNDAERIFSIFLMFTGSVIFGILLAEVNEAMNQVRRMERVKENHTQQLIDFTKEHQVPMELTNEILIWSSFNFEHQQSENEKAEAMKQLPDVLYAKVMKHLHMSLLSRVPFIGALDEACNRKKEQVALSGSFKDQMSDGLSFSDHLWSHVQSEIFFNQEVMVHYGDELDRIMIVVEGRAVLEDMNDNKKCVMKFANGDYVGECALLGMTNIGTPYNNERLVLRAATHVKVLSVTKQYFDACVSKFGLHDQLEQALSDMMDKEKSNTSKGGGALSRAMSHRSNLGERPRRTLKTHNEDCQGSSRILERTETANTTTSAKGEEEETAGEARSWGAPFLEQKIRSVLRRGGGTVTGGGVSVIDANPPTNGKAGPKGGQPWEGIDERVSKLCDAVTELKQQQERDVNAIKSQLGVITGALQHLAAAHMTALPVHAAAGRPPPVSQRQVSPTVSPYSFREAELYFGNLPVAPGEQLEASPSQRQANDWRGGDVHSQSPPTRLRSPSNPPIGRALLPPVDGVLASSSSGAFTGPGGSPVVHGVEFSGRSADRAGRRKRATDGLIGERAGGEV